MEDKVIKVFGIDLGTTYSSIAYVDDYGKALIVPNSENQPTTPSVVFFDEESIIVGDVAKESSRLYPNEVVSFVKRSMGESNFLFEHNSKTYHAEEISSFILRKIAKDTEKNIGEKVKNVVITCPAYFGINEREATKKAGEIAGLNVLQVINEPTAAAIAYGADKTNENKTILVYDLGGGTFDITMIYLKKKSIEVICTGGNHNLGGKDWDDRIVQLLVQKFQQKTGIQEDILDDPDTCQDIQLSAEKAKIILSQRKKTPISITHNGKRVKVELDHDKFNEITNDLVERTITFSLEMLGEAKKKGYDCFDEILLVGGGTRIPQIAKRLKKEFGITPKSFDPDEAVAKGAAIYGLKLALKDEMAKKIINKMDINEAAVELTEIIDNTPKKIIDEITMEIVNETDLTKKAVEQSTIKIKDVASKSFGVVAKNNNKEEFVFNVINKNSSVPIDTTKTFYTAVDDQDTVLIRIMENLSIKQNVSLDQSIEIGMAILELPAGLKADTPINITFQLNKEGCLQTNAVESSESRSVNIVIETQSVIQGKELEEAKIRCQSIIVH